jgi:hypothetical protein
MATVKQRAAARKNIRKAQKAWQGMSKRQHSLSQPQGRGRKKPGTTGKGNFYRIEIRPKGQFSSFRVQDVGAKGGLERLAGRRRSGSWDTVSWLISKDRAHIDARGKLVIDNAKDKASLRKAIRGPVVHAKGDVFRAHPAKNVPEKAKPTPAMRRAQKTNIKKAQIARRRR